MVRQAHHPELLQRLEIKPDEGLTALDRILGWINSMSAALQAAGSVWQGVNDVVSGGERVFCAVRPRVTTPSSIRAGVCLLNSVSDRGDQRAEPDIDRVAILDFDVHHGNGTVDLCQRH